MPSQKQRARPVRMPAQTSPVRRRPISDGLLSGTLVTVSLDQLAHAKRISREIMKVLKHATPGGRLLTASKYCRELPYPYHPDWVSRANELVAIIAAARRIQRSATQLNADALNEALEDKVRIAELLIESIEARRKLLPVGRKVERTRQRQRVYAADNATLTGPALDAAKELCTRLERKKGKAPFNTTIARAIGNMLEDRYPDAVVGPDRLRQLVGQWRKGDNRN